MIIHLCLCVTDYRCPIKCHFIIKFLNIFKEIKLFIEVFHLIHGFCKYLLLLAYYSKISFMKRWVSLP
jgi:hypothetical protein